MLASSRKVGCIGAHRKMRMSPTAMLFDLAQKAWRKTRCFALSGALTRKESAIFLLKPCTATAAGSCPPINTRAYALSLIGSGWFCEGRSEDRPLRDCTDLCRGRCWHRPETFGDSGLRFGSKRADLMIGPYGIAEPSVGAAMGRPLKMRRKDTMRKIGGAKRGG